MVRRWLLGVALMAGFAVPLHAETLKFHAVMGGSSEVPASNSTGTGAADATLNTETHKLIYDVTFSGFSSAVTMAHFHGPAAVGANAGVQVPLGKAPTSPIHGDVTLTEAQQQQLMSGQWYANVHTANHPKGAIRGQLTPSK